MARLGNLNPYDMHRMLINTYILKQPGDTNNLVRDTSKDRTDRDVIRENHKFLWDDDPVDTWEKQLAKRYYDKLFKEYCIADLSRYKENKIALRWRVEKEVVLGKGQFICGNKVCTEKLDLRSWEVNFAYAENGIRKNALIKVRLCPPCSKKLNYHSKKREIKKFKRINRKNRNSSKHIDENNDEHQSDVAHPSHYKETESADSDGKESILNSQTDEEKEKERKRLEQNCWSKGPEIEEKSREEEFDEYLEDLLL